MKLITRRYFYILLLLINSLKLIAQDAYYFIENQKQWDKKILYKTELKNGAMFLERNCLTYNFIDGKDINHNHQHFSVDTIFPLTNKASKNNLAHFHSYKVLFQNAKLNPTLVPTEVSSDYTNYFYGGIYV